MRISSRRPFKNCHRSVDCGASYCTSTFYLLFESFVNRSLDIVSVDISFCFVSKSFFQFVSCIVFRSNRTTLNTTKKVNAVTKWSLKSISHGFWRLRYVQLSSWKSSAWLLKIVYVKIYNVVWMSFCRAVVHVIRTISSAIIMLINEARLVIGRWNFVQSLFRALIAL